jgi:DNA-binding response OmpR family regulator
MEEMRGDAVAEDLDVIPGCEGNPSKAQRVIMRMLMEREGQTVSRREIWQSLYGDRPIKEQPVCNTIAVFVNRIRVRLKNTGWRIITVVREGYQLVRHSDG